MADIKEITDNTLESLSEKTPEIIKNNKGALVGAVIGFLLTDNKKAQSTILGAIAGSLVADKKDEE